MPDDPNILTAGYTFSQIHQIVAASDLQVVDFLGIVHEIEPMIEIKTRAGKSMLKLNIWLADRSGGTICLVGYIYKI